jgi:glycerol-3-phosphate dehydrogenase (NAD(P)+)
MTTCMSRHSRNRSVGEQIGRGRSLEEILAGTTKVAEGIWTARSVHELARSQGLSTPVVDQVYRVLFERLPPMEAVRELMSREMKPER